MTESTEIPGGETTAADGTAPLPTAGRRYALLAELGRGGMATAYLAAKHGPGGFAKVLVVKRLRPSLAAEPELLKMFLDEAKLAARIEHPNVVHTQEVGYDGENYVIAMEYVDGQSLEQISRALAAPREGDEPLALGAQLLVVTQVLAGLHFAHELTDFDGSPLSIVHRDVSPHNVMVSYEGNVKLLDFGIAKAATSQSNTLTGVVKGKTAYMSAEQFGGVKTIDRRADVFAVGVILWQMLVGRRLWLGLSDAEIFAKVALGDIPRPRSLAPDVDPELEAICMKALARAPQERYTTAADMMAALEARVRARPELHATPRELGAWVAARFAEPRAKLRKTIEEALTSGRRSQEQIETLPVSQRWPGSGDGRRSAGETEATATAIPQVVAARAEKMAGRSRMLVGGLAVAVALAAVAAATLARDRGAASNVESAPSAPPAAGTAKVSVHVTPRAAEVSVDGRPLVRRGDVLVGTFARDDVPHGLRASAPGYVPHAEEVLLDATQVSLDVTLVPSPPSSASAASPSESAAPPSVRRPVVTATPAPPPSAKPEPVASAPPAPSAIAATPASSPAPSASTPAHRKGHDIDPTNPFRQGEP